MSPEPSWRWRLSQLLLLAVAAWAATYSRVAIGPLQESLKRSLDFSDHEIALLQGLGLALPLALGSIPLGLLADRISRVRMLLFWMSVGLLSCVLSAFSSDFLSMVVSRGLAGLAVAGVSIAAYSMSGDLFPPTQRGRATMVMAIGEICGAPAAFALGGALLVWVANMPGISLIPARYEEWRVSLLVMGSLLLPALVAMLFLREPARTEVISRKPSLHKSWVELWQYRKLALPLHLARASLFIADGAVFVWGAPLFARNYHLSPDRVGALMGMVLLTGGLLGPVLGGLLVDYCQRRGGSRLTISVMAVVALLGIPSACFSMMPSASSAGIMLGAFLVFGFTIAAAGVALFVIVIPGELRGLNLGISYVVGSLFFVGLAPLVVSELAETLGGEMMIGKALTIVCVTMSVLNASILSVSARNFPGPRAKGSSGQRSETNVDESIATRECL